MNPPEHYAAQFEYLQRAEQQLNSPLSAAAGPSGTGRKTDKEPTYFCPAEGCNKAYGSYGGLYLHKRSHHPELIPKSEEEERERKRSKRDKAPPAIEPYPQPQPQPSPSPLP